MSEGKASIREVAEETARMNPTVTAEELMKDVEVDPDEPSQALGPLSWQGKRISELPGIIGDLTIKGDLYLNDNKLTSLPEGFWSLTVGEGLHLSNNGLVSLPEGIESLTVGCDLRLNDNKLASLPKGFGSLTIGGHLLLYYNKLASLPEDFGSLSVIGSCNGHDGYVNLGNNPMAASVHTDSFPGLYLHLDDY